MPGKDFLSLNKENINDKFKVKSIEFFSSSELATLIEKGGGRII